MSLKKRFVKSRKKCKVTFQLPVKSVDSGTEVKVLGDFNYWSWKNGTSLRNNQKIGLSTVLLFAFVLTGLYAQETIPAAGGLASSSEGTISYSVGQMVYTTNIGTDGSVSQGVQQPYEISIITGLEDAAGINLESAVYPNPTSNFLYLKIESYNNEQLSYHLFNGNGKLLEDKRLTGEVTAIPMSHFVPAIYFLKVIDEQKELKTFKVIKH